VHLPSRKDSECELLALAGVPAKHSKLLSFRHSWSASSASNCGSGASTAGAEHWSISFQARCAKACDLEIWLFRWRQLPSAFLVMVVRCVECCREHKKMRAREIEAIDQKVESARWEIRINELSHQTAE
jgi:hypothetical protein